VFRTYDPAHDRLVAVKAFRLDLTPEQAGALADQLRSAAEAALDHPSIVRPIAGGVEGSLAYAASEYVAAESLDVALRHYAPAAIERVLPFITQLAGAVDFARTAGIGHGALHPRDIFVTPDEARATGFGVVQALEALGVRAPVRRPYTAPERVEGGAWDTRADVYSLAAIAYELLTGRRAVGADIGDLGAMGGAHAEALAAVLSRALADDPGARFPAALAFAAALEAASRGERTTTAIEEVRAVAEAPAAYALQYEYEAEAEAAPSVMDQEAAASFDEPAPDRERPPEEHAAQVDDDLSEIHLREEDAARAPSETAQDGAGGSIAAGALASQANGEEGFSLFDEEVNREREDLASGVRDVDLAAEPERRFDVTEFQESTFTGPEREEQEEKVAAVVVEPPEPIEPLESTAPVEPVRRRNRPRPVLLPVALTLLLGLFVGFVAGYLVGARDRGAEGIPSELPQASEAEPTTTTASEPQPPPSTAAPPEASERPPEPAPSPAARGAPPVPTARGRLVVRSTPPGAQVFVNGRRRGTTPLSVRDLVAGTYTVRVAREGFREATQRVSIGRSGAREVNIRLARERPRAAAPAARADFTGGLFVDSRPRGARVLLDGREIGKTPLQVGDIKAGSHVVRMELPNHRPWSASTRIVAGQTVRVTGSLERQQP
jgi:hypothetical protein